MAVEARHFNPFPSQILLSNRETIFSGTESMQNLYGLAPISTETMTTMYDFPVKEESDLNYPHMGVSLKRPRQENNFVSNQLLPRAAVPNLSNNRCSAAPFTFLGQDFSEHMQLEKLELDRFINHHMEKVRLELEDRQKIYNRRLIASVGATMMKNLKAKEAEIQKMGRLNIALEERLKSLYIENQIWRDLAQTNEATANTLRTNLEQVLAIVQDDKTNGADDAELCCGSNYEEELTERVVRSNGVDGSGGYDGRENRRVCRSCGKEEASVLLLPCRHLCLCAVCGSSVQICPVCNSIKNCSLYVNMSS